MKTNSLSISNLLLIVFTFSIMILFINGCGGGGGSGGGGASNPNTPTAQAPTIVSFTPTLGTTSLSTTPAISIAFSQAMNASTLNTSNIQLMDMNNNVIPENLVVSTDTTNISITFNQALSEITQYQVILNSSNILGQNGLALGTSQLILTNFTTGSFSAPQIAGTNIQNDATQVPQNPALQITFSKAMNVATVNANNISLIDANGNLVALNNFSVTPDNMTLSFTPTATLNQFESYQIMVNETLLAIHLAMSWVPMLVILRYLL